MSFQWQPLPPPALQVFTLPSVLNSTLSCHFSNSSDLSLLSHHSSAAFPLIASRILLHPLTHLSPQPLTGREGRNLRKTSPTARVALPHAVSTHLCPAAPEEPPGRGRDPRGGTAGSHSDMAAFPAQTASKVWGSEGRHSCVQHPCGEAQGKRAPWLMGG